MSLFYATRPLSNPELVRLKHKAALRASLVSCAALGMVVGLGLLWTGQYSSFVELRKQRLASYQSWEIIVLALGSVVGLILVGWGMMITGFFFALSGRRWVVTSFLIGATVAALSLSLLMKWLTSSRPEHWETFQNVLPWILVGLLGLKLWLAQITLRELCRRQWMTPLDMMTKIFAWLLCVILFSAFCYWLFATSSMTWYHWLPAMALLVPFNRVYAASLVLDWNRHR